MATSTPVDKASENDRGPCLTCCIQTSSHCKACVGVRPDTETMHKAYFCGKECQTAGWPEHKKLCKHVQIVKRLYRAGDILQRIFFIARKHTFEFSIDKVEKKNGKLHIHQSTTPISGFFTEFPDHLNLAIEDREALMAYNCCGGAIMAIHSIVPMLLNDICKSIQYIKVRTPMSFIRQRIVWPLPYPGLIDDYLHEVILLDLETGGSYILDLAGAQFGYPAPVYMKEWWMNEWQPSHITSHPFESFANIYNYVHGFRAREIFRPGMSLQDKYVELQMVNGERIEQIASTFQFAWAVLEGQKVTLREALRLKVEDWREYSTGLCTEVDKCLKDFWELEIQFD